MKILEILSESRDTFKAITLRELYDKRRVLKQELNAALIDGEDETIQDIDEEIAKVDAEIKQLEASLNEAVNHMGDREYQTYAGWKAACKKAYPECSFRGDKDIGAAVLGNKDVGEWDGAVGSVYARKQVTESIDHKEMLRGLQKALDKASADLAEMEDDLRSMKGAARTEKEHDAVEDFRAAVEKKRALVERLIKRVKLRKAALGGKA